MYFRYWSVILLLLITVSLRAQVRSVNDSGSRSKRYVFLSPLKTLDPANPGILYGAGVAISPRITVEVGHLWLFSSLPHVPEASGNRGNRFHFAVRNYVPVSISRRGQCYVQIRGDLLQRTHQHIVSIQPLADRGAGPVTDYLDSVTVAARVTTLNAMVGVEEPIGKRFVIDLSVGLGKRWKYVRHEDRIEPDDLFIESPTADDDFYYRNKPERGGGYFNIPFDLRLVYRL